ncbi:hypothetical protein L7F22_049955 [Adiantum nelumboides]|nr:hypothetical protein [Adiantum nelumboides]
MRNSSMKRASEKGVTPFSCMHEWVNIKALLILVLLVNTLILACVIFSKYTLEGPPCSSNKVEDSFKISQGIASNERARKLNASHKIINGHHVALDEFVSPIDENVQVEHSSNIALSAEEPINVNNVSVIQRQFKAVGSAAFVFVQFGAYRGADNGFAIVGLGSKPLHVYGNAEFRCEWEPAKIDGGGPSSSIEGQAKKFLPDWGLGRVYTVVVVNCTFKEGVGVDGQGGKLTLHATSNGMNMASFVAMDETKNSYAANSAIFKSKNYTYDFLYCGSSLFGDINPQRIREWLAYHVRLMGPKSHFVFYDAGGVSPTVRQALLKWQALGHVSIHDIREQAKFDGYYYNQFLVLNDCLHRTRFLAKWTFFFDVDEYLYVPPPTTLLNTMQMFSNYSQITIGQSFMSSKLCLPSPSSSTRGMWAFERLVFCNIKRGVRWDRKYAIQARNVLATGVHWSENIVGKTLHTKRSSIKYYHYHNTITIKTNSLCQEFVNCSCASPVAYSDEDPFQIDLGMQYFAHATKEFELQKIGPQPFFE